jgi:tungstate transport system permease protein
MHPIVDGLIRAIWLILTANREVVVITMTTLRGTMAAVAMSSLIGIPLGVFLALRNYPAKRIVINLINTSMGLPPVVVGLFVFILLSRDGPLGQFQLLFTLRAMILAQFILMLPMVTGLTISAIQSVGRDVIDTARSLGADRLQLTLLITREAKIGILTGIIVALGQGFSEVGAIMLVGGNIRWVTRALTTAIVLETRKGEFALAIALGIILISLSYAVNLGLTYLQQSGERR